MANIRTPTTAIANAWTLGCCAARLISHIELAVSPSPARPEAAASRPASGQSSAEPLDTGTRSLSRTRVVRDSAWALAASGGSRLG